MTQDKATYVVFGVLALVTVLLAYSIMGMFTNSPSRTGGSGLVQELFASQTTGSTDSGDVSIELTPKGFSQGMLNVEISANTHSVDLSGFDLAKITKLDVEGQTVLPFSAPSLSGHHASGVIQFSIGQEISKFSITIEGIPKVQDRVYHWG